MISPPFNPRLEKRALRQAMLPLRASAKAANPNASLTLRDLFLSEIPLPTGSIIAFYNAFRDEIDPLPLVAALAIKGHTLCLPIVTEKKQPLSFHLWTEETPLVKGMWEIQEPPSFMPKTTPSVILVPVMAFDSNCHRLGYGGGFYDRTISLLRKTQPLIAIGLAYAAQEVALVPTDRNDVRLDAIATEAKIFRS